MPKLRRLSGHEVVAILKPFGFLVVAQRGSHMKLKRIGPDEAQVQTVPAHASLDVGTSAPSFVKPAASFLKISYTRIFIIREQPPRGTMVRPRVSENDTSHSTQEAWPHEDLAGPGPDAVASDAPTAFVLAASAAGGRAVADRVIKPHPLFPSSASKCQVKQRPQ